MKGAVNAIGIVRDFEDKGEGSGLETKKAGGGPKHLTKIFKAGNAIGIIGQEGIVSREPEPSNPLYPGPVLVNGLVPDRVVS